MSEPIKNTLFRFATLRAPALLSDEVKSLGFVQHPDFTQSEFYLLTQGGYNDRGHWLSGAIDRANAIGAFSSVEQLKGWLEPNFSQFVTWLAQNREQLKNGTSSITDYGEIPGIDQATSIVLWDNLFYQLITNRNAPLRELIVQCLIAGHAQRFSDGGNWQEFYAVKVAIPPSFLAYSQSVSPMGDNSPIATRRLQNVLLSAVAASRLRAIEKTIEELKKAEALADKQNRAAYNSAKESYDATMAQLIKQHTQYNEATGEFTTTPFDMAPFAFAPTTEMNADYLSTSLSSESAYIVQQAGLWDGATYAEAIESLGQKLKEQSAVVFKNRSFSKRILGLGGLILSLSDETAALGKQYGYLIAAHPVGPSLYKVFVVVNVGYSNASASNLTYWAVVNGISQNAAGSTETTQGNALTLELFPAGLSIPQGANSFQLNGQLTLANGVVLSFNTTVPLGSYATGQMTLNQASNQPEADFFTPTGFGVKRLGIADYRKVEQSVCCYVPGEVSHIENIMAREYKERSTRRLRRSEDTITVEKQTEKEDLTDTTSTDRYEMQQQVSSVLNKDTAISAYASSTFSAFGAQVSIGGNFATNTSQQQSNSQAVTYAKDVTERALERVVQKVREERITKIIEEYEEQNKHGFDNKTGDSHISGVYRWVDKVYQNRVFNYGKRLMYEFMVPQPARFHEEAIKSIPGAPAAVTLEKPVDPRTVDLFDFRSLNEATAAHWAAVYGAEIEAAPQRTLNVSKSFRVARTDGENGSHADKIELPEGYQSVSAVLSTMFAFQPKTIDDAHMTITVGDKRHGIPWGSKLYNDTVFLPFGSPIQKEVNVAAEASDIGACAYSVVLNCVCTDAYYQKWQLATFHGIMDAYNDKLEAYNQALANVQTPAAVKAMNPRFFRLIENTVLRKSCLNYLLPDGKMGQQYYKGSTVTDIMPDVTAGMDRYAALVKFMEQAFEWDEMSYNFYPFYWGEKSKWQAAYQQDADDALFRSFLQSGMARVVVTVRPGFEEAVMHYIATGQIWNGGEAPVVGDDLYLSIVEELKKPTGYVDETWETRVPTTLTLIQKGVVALNAEGLPCDCGTATGIVQGLLPSRYTGGGAYPIDPVPQQVINSGGQ